MGNEKRNTAYVTRVCLPSSCYVSPVTCYAFMKYVILKDRGKQYRVQEGQEIFLDRLENPNGKLEITDILLYVDGDAVKIGTPAISDIKVICGIEGEEKGEKLHIVTYKAKSRYRRKKGFRPVYTRVKVEKIVVGK